MRKMDEQKHFSNMEYTHSADSLFHFMKRQTFLVSALEKKRLVPRYCDENIGYLKLNIPKHQIMVLDKCFCDIPMHKLTEPFHVELAENNDSSSNCKNIIQNQKTHPDFYGEFAIAFSKDWCTKNNLQPVHYVNPESSYIECYRKMFNWAISQDETQDVQFDVQFNEILSKLAYLKPVVGTMRRYDGQNGEAINYIKNFHDEKEWRFIPKDEDLKKAKKSAIIYNSRARESVDIINNSLEREYYKGLWLRFDYRDIRYIIVPNNVERNEIINTILELHDTEFGDSNNGYEQKLILISKILVLQDIRRDW